MLDLYVIPASTEIASCCYFLQYSLRFSHAYLIRSFSRLRAYIQFPRTDKDAAQSVNPSVCFAVKLRYCFFYLHEDYESM